MSKKNPVQSMTERVRRGPAPSATPVRSLTVCEGRETLGFIHEMAAHHFNAESLSGLTLGAFPTRGDAAQAINAEHKKSGASQ